MPRRIEDLSGKIFGRLSVLRFSGKIAHGQTFWTCQCDCGNKKDISRNCLLHKKEPTRSCGCLQKDKARANRKHGMCGHPLYKVWTCMKQRCLNPKNPDYHLYGGRGITICDRWKNDFRNFLNDMGNPPNQGQHKGQLSIHRIDNDKGYYPGNCRWANTEEQALEKRRMVTLTINGETKPLLTWCKEHDILYATAIARLRHGWDHKDIIFHPIATKRGAITYKGKTMRLADWAREIGISSTTLGARLRSGWSIEKTLTHPLIY